ncbi:MAG: transglycosylase domain-containing protein, partial [Pseudomonadota bacterium]
MATRRRRPAHKNNWLSMGLIVKLFLFATVLVGAWVLYLDITVRQKFDGKKWAVPARVYAQALNIYQGLSLSADELEHELKALGYRFVSHAQAPGQVSKSGHQYQIFTRGFAFWDKTEQPSYYRVAIEENQVSELAGADNLSLRLEPQEIGSIYPSHGEDRIIVPLEQVPPLLGETLIAVEDKHFARHHGISLKGIARAVVANLKAGGLVQGGSTITQQLVKNFYLSHERSLWRKIQEAVMSLLLERHYTKADILEAYINEVYLGQSGPRAIHGFGLGAQHYFNRPLKRLQIHQIALLVSSVKGASYYNPWRHPKRAKQRRDLVLRLMADSQLITATQLNQAIRQPLGVSDFPHKQQGDYPAFLDLVKRQLQRDYRPEDLQSEGLRIFTTLSPSVQRYTEHAIKGNLQGLNQRAASDIQAAAVVTAVGSGEVLAVVGDRNPRFSGFNRALDAERQVGSLVKPFVYLTAFMQPQHYQLSSVVPLAQNKIAKHRYSMTVMPYSAI